MCCTRLAENTGCKNDAKNRYLSTIAQLCRAISSQLRHISTIGKKLVKQQYLLHMILQYGELRPTSGWDLFVSLGCPANFNRFRVLASNRYCSDVAQRKPTKLCTMFGCLLRGYTIYIHFWRLLPRNRILPGAKFSLRRPSLALSYWQRYCTALEQWARAKLCGFEHRAPPIFGRATITLGTGPHSSFY